ncbi:hypothetical protein [Pseudonocardia sp. ICBG601]|uniref:hypothetical protein n=1 Tax=Pseudonocardia sp. ICBG601 TaxID=2846759 RepID=UPI001CF6E082|nr:hypothetical protein [Pseudonocardia sp. ICBG601]
MRDLHNYLAPENFHGSSGLRRTSRWLAKERMSTSHFDNLVRSRWGSFRLARLQSWLEQTELATHSVLLHGFASLGVLLPPILTTTTEFLIGADIAAGRPEVDLGWLLGELAEVARTTCREIVDFDELSRLLLQGYGPGYNEIALGRIAVLRMVTHLHDYATYVEWNADCVRHADFLVDLIDDEGRSTLPGRTM